MRLREAIYRERLHPSDGEIVRRLVASSGFFYPEEVEVAVELVEERRAKGAASGYHFWFAEISGDVSGYTCFGPIPCTSHSFDIYWIVVAESFRGLGLGKELLRKAEETIGAMGGRRIYVETASRPLYEPTRAFYRRCGYGEEATLRDFYGPGDDKIIFLKVLP